MRCPFCAHEDSQVKDSRPSEDGAAIRRRRQCEACGARFTTFERVEELGLSVLKRDGTKEPYDREKVVAGISKALKNRPVTAAQVQNVASRIESRLRRKGPVVTSDDVGLEVLAMLAKLDQVAYLRFASVYKDFQQAADFERELGTLQKREPAKRRTRA